MRKASPVQSQSVKAAELIMRVRSGGLSAREAARQLGLSRKTYYKWEGRMLTAAVEALKQERPRGRPPKPRDPHREALSRRLREQDRQIRVLEQSLAISRALVAEAGKKGTKP